VVGAKYPLALLFGVAVGLWVLAAAPAAAGAEEALLTILRQAVADEAVAAAVKTFNCHHTGEFTFSPVVEPLPIFRYTNEFTDALEHNPHRAILFYIHVNPHDVFIGLIGRPKLD
jgi:hypothetical protein